MSANNEKLLERANEGGKFTLDEIRNHFAPLSSQRSVMELTARIHVFISDYPEPERAAALACALMMELI